MASNRYSIAIVGGTGPQEKGLSYRFGRGGHDVVLGSRDAGGEAVASEVRDRLISDGGAGRVQGMANADAIDACEVVILTVPYGGHDELVASLPLNDRSSSLA